jgi:Arc/MetJ-type ribon-helix-helix transcriptional regulator
MQSAKKISITVTPEMLRVIRESVDAGEYASISEVIRDAMRVCSTVDGIARRSISGGTKPSRNGRAKISRSRTFQHTLPAISELGYHFAARSSGFEHHGDCKWHGRARYRREFPGMNPR